MLQRLHRDLLRTEFLEYRTCRDSFLYHPSKILTIRKFKSKFDTLQTYVALLSTHEQMWLYLCLGLVCTDNALRTSTGNTITKIGMGIEHAGSSELLHQHL